MHFYLSIYLSIYRLHSQNVLHASEALASANPSESSASFRDLPESLESRELCGECFLKLGTMLQRSSLTISLDTKVLYTFNRDIFQMRAKRRGKRGICPYSLYKVNIDRDFGRIKWHKNEM